MAEKGYAELVAENERLHAHVATLEDKICRLEKALDEALRRSKRQAAPFSKGKLKAKPKRPGRKPGDQYGLPAQREPPPTIDEVHEAALPDFCPGCGGGIRETHVDHQYQTEIPRQPIHRRFNIHVGTCTGCGQCVRGRHQLQTSDAVGAAASQLGPLAQAAMVILNKRGGLSHGKVQSVMRDLFGVNVSRGGVCQAIARVGRKLEPAYQQIGEHVRTSALVCPDETGWRVGGKSAWLHAAATPEATWYRITVGRGGDVLEELLGSNWDGVMVHDGWSPYDRFTEAVHQQCVFHIKTRIKEMLTTAVGSARVFPRRVLELFDDALAQRDRVPTLDVDMRVQLAESFCERLRGLVDRPKSQPTNERLARHLYKHLPDWFVFLADPAVPAANTLGEQAMRPAVVNRKVWGGNRTWIGAFTQQVTTSVLDTCRKLGTQVTDFLTRTICSTETPFLALPAPR